MKKLQYALLALFLFGLVPGMSFADTTTVNTPKSEKGDEVNPLYGGYMYRRLAGSTTEILVCSGKCLLAGVLMNTGPATSALRLRDSGTADGTPDQAALILRLGFNVIDTSPSFRKVDIGARTVNGITAKLNTATNGVEEATILYIPLGRDN